MKRPLRMAAMTAGVVAVLLLLTVAAAVVALRSQWFHDRVRERIVSEVERATGGRSEVRAFSFDWRALRAEVRGFVLHGTEEAGKPPLFEAGSIRVGLKVVSLLKKDVDIDSVAVAEPRIHLIVYPGGRTNVPAPRVRRNGRPAMETILKLAVGRFQVDRGIFEIENQGRTPFSAHGENLTARLGYDASGPRYQGEVSMRPLDFAWGSRKPVPVDVDLMVGVYGGRIEVTAGRFATGNSQVAFSGAVEDIAKFQAGFDYKARLDLADLKRIVEVNAPPSGEALVAGKARFDGFAHYDIRGKLNAARVGWSHPDLWLRDFRAEGTVSLTPARLESRDMRVSGNALLGRKTQPQPVEGRIESVTLRNRDLEAAGIRLAAMDGSFVGQAELREWHRYRVGGEVSGFSVRRLVALYSDQQVPWDGRVSGPVRVEGSFRTKSSVVAAAQVAVTPAASGPPVQGHLDAMYTARGATIDLGRSWLQLPATRVDFSGVLGKQLAVRMETRDLDDVLPALNVKSMPVRLESGPASFSGTVTGPLNDPRIAGTASAAHFAVGSAHFDGFQGTVAATKTKIELRDARLSRGSLQAQFEADAGLIGWKSEDSLPVWMNGSVRNAAVSDVLTVAGRADMQASGTLDASAKITGRWGAPLVALNATVMKGSLYGEPFDRLIAIVNHGGDNVEVGSGRIEAGRKQIAWKARYQHAAGDFDEGRVQFEISSNVMPVAEIQRVREERPDLGGTVQFAVAGDVEVRRGNGGHAILEWRELRGNADTEGLTMNGRQLGSARLKATTEQGVLSAHLTSDFAGSAVRGDGEWRLAQDYPGRGRLTFTKLDFVRLRELFTAPGASRLMRFAGSMAGEVSAEGPFLQPEKWRAAARITQLQLSTAPGTGPANGTQDLTLRNSGPVTALMENGVLKLESARFVGRSTDLTVGGVVNIKQKNALDLKVKGRVDLAMLQDFDRDLEASGVVNTETSVRGALDDPQVNGRMEMQNAAFSLATFPQGIYNANGVVAFNGTRATIQSLTGESGGGKVRVAGFASFEGEQMLFRLFLRAEQVRVRYPEGVSTVANAALNWTGTSDRSTLAGTVTIVRTGFNPQSDFSSILARQLEPVRTPTSRTGILSGTNFDVQIETAPDITFESSLAQDIQAEANLRLRGTATNPAMLGRITITQGRLVFFGTRYNISQGSISFFNPARIEPILNIDLETKARGVDVTLTVSGPIEKLNLTPRSDPPLQFNEIVALLATGRAPTSDPALLTQQATSPQSWQQMGASALLGQAIANPVAGRLQRFFGVTRLKIDPSLTGVDNNPQARLTLEQQITPSITFTYMTNVTNSNPLVVQVEWAVNRTWSVLAVREENGLFGLDFLLKKRF
ncbi:MAG TPA: translocation/assembly module TamB domain-containing protein [Bryobacteraceae bacterium]|nr:translocation/assembly module TamB domain-containing protein [Bryobacteraceae bacterium]